MAASSKERLLEAAYACVARWGMAKTTMEDVAREAHVSRATVYRHFPGGKDDLFREVVRWEAGHFFARLTKAVVDRVEFADLLEEALVVAHRELESHVVLQRMLQTEPERLLPVLTTENARLLSLVKQFLVLAVQRAPLTTDVPIEAATDYLARMMLSLIGSPGRWDLTDRAQVRDLVRVELLGGLTRF